MEFAPQVVIVRLYARTTADSVFRKMKLAPSPICSMAVKGLNSTPLHPPQLERGLFVTQFHAPATNIPRTGSKRATTDS